MFGARARARPTPDPPPPVQSVRVRPCAQGEVMERNACKALPQAPSKAALAEEALGPHEPARDVPASSVAMEGRSR